MTPRQLWREGGPVEGEQLHRHNLAQVFRWLTEAGIDVELHRPHGALLHLDSGPLRVDYGDWVTVGRGGRVEVWDAAEFTAEHREVS